MTNQEMIDALNAANKTTQSVIDALSVPVAPPPVVPPATPSHIQGFLDTAGATVSGWAGDDTAPTLPVTVILSIDGKDIVTTKTDQPSTDVTAVFPQFTGTHRYAIPVPASFADGSQHTAQVFGIGNDGTTRFELTGSPMKFFRP
jgi:hypothetical protein